MTVQDQSASYYSKNRESIIAKVKARRMAMDPDERRRKESDASKRWRLKNLEKVREISKRSRKKNFLKRKSNPQYRIKHKLSKACIAYQKHGKSGGIRFMSEVSGLSRGEFRKAFPDRAGFTFDHKIPFCAFDLTNPEHVVRCAYWMNLQYIPAIENYEKNSKHDPIDVMTMPWVGTPESLSVAERFIEKKARTMPREFCWMI